MNDLPDHVPPLTSAIFAETEAIGFKMASEPKTGSLLRTLAASKPGGQFLELGTGTGYATAWILAGMDRASHLISVELEAKFQQIARKHLGSDPRVEFVESDGAKFLADAGSARFDLIFADTWAGKYTHFEETLASLKVGGYYVIDDMLPQPNWPHDHPPKVARLLEILGHRRDLALTRMSWATGIVLAVKTQ